MKLIHSEVIYAKFQNLPTKTYKGGDSQKYYCVFPKSFVEDIQFRISMDEPENECDAQYTAKKMNYGIKPEETGITT